MKHPGRRGGSSSFSPATIDKSRIGANKDSIQAQLDADKKKADAEAEAAKAKVDAENK